jgi:hypothetical protein
MRRGWVVWLGCSLVLAALAAPARAERDLTENELRDEMQHNRMLEAYIERNGMPDLATARFLADTQPWDDHEVALYYLDKRQEIGFARAYILGRPQVELERYRRPLTDEQVAALAARTRQRPLDSPAPDLAPAPPPTPRRGGALSPLERAEESARRSEDAAMRVERAADAAERAADRAEAVTESIQTSFRESLKK